MHPDIATLGPVYGHPKSVQPWDAREPGEKCGINAKLFAPKPPEPPKPKRWWQR
jgi:hypothetical protein